MNILSVNTAINQYGLAIIKDEVLAGQHIIPPDSNHFKNLMPSLESLLNRVSITPQQIDGLVVAIGPGSFTGIRVGLSIVKGLSYCLNIPIIGISTLEAMACQLPYTDRNICPLIASRKGEFFTALFRYDQDGKLLKVKAEVCLKIGDLVPFLNDETIFIGNDFTTQSSDLKKHFISPGYLLAPPILWNLKVSSLGFLGCKKLQKGMSVKPATIVPFYLRSADIRPPKGLEIP